MKKRILILCLATLMLTGCSRQPALEVAPTGESTAPVEGEKVSAQIDVSTLFTDRDRAGDYDTQNCARITLNGTSASCDSDAVQISGSTVTITDEGTYILSGTLENGTVVVNAAKEDKTQLVLDGVSVSSQTGAAIYILQADKVFVTLAEGTENTLANGGSFEAVDDNNVDGVIFPKRI